jgi:hypothetical protein
MPVKITLTLDDKVTPGVKDIAAAFKKATVDVENVDAGMNKLAGDVAKVKQEADGAASSVKKTGEALSKAAGESGGGVAGKITAIATSFVALKQLGEVAGRGIQFASEKVKQFADQGIPEFQRMERAAGGVSGAWDNLLITFGKTKATGGIVRESLDNIAFALDSISGTSEETRERLQGIAAATKDLKAIDAQVAANRTTAAIQEVESLDEINEKIANQRQLIEELGKSATQSEESRKANAQTLLALEQQKAALLKRQADLTKVIEDYEGARASESEGYRLKEITDLESINDLIDAQKDKLRELARDDTATSDDIAEAKRELATAEARRKELLNESAEASKKANDELQQLVQLDREYKAQQQHQGGVDAADARKRDAELEIERIKASIERRKQAGADSVEFVKQAEEEIERLRNDALEAEKDKIREEGKLAQDLAKDDVERRRAMYDELKKLRDADKRHAEQTAREKVQGEIAAEQEKDKRIKDLAGKFGGGMKLDDAQKQFADITKGANADLAKLQQQKIQQYVNGDVKGFMESSKEEFRIKQETYQKLAELKRKFEKEGGALEQIKAGISDRDKLNQIMQNRFNEATEGKDLSKGELAKARRDAFRSTKRDFERGNIGEEEVAKATNDLTKQTIDAAQSSKKLSDEQKEALRASFDAQKSLAQNQKQAREEIAALRQDFEDLKSLTDDDSMSQARGRASRYGK